MAIKIIKSWLSYSSLFLFFFLFLFWCGVKSANETCQNVSSEQEGSSQGGSGRWAETTSRNDALSVSWEQLLSLLGFHYRHPCGMPQQPLALATCSQVFKFAHIIALAMTGLSHCSSRGRHLLVGRQGETVRLAEVSCGWGASSSWWHGSYNTNRWVILSLSPWYAWACSWFLLLLGLPARQLLIYAACCCCLLPAAVTVD